MSRVTATLIALVLGVGIGLGCAGGRGDVRFDSLRYPVSMSGYVYGPKNRALSPRSLEVVSEFEHEGRLWGVLFSWLPVSGDLDLSDEINSDVEAAGGEGVINLSVKSEGCVLNYIPGLSLIPMWPGCANVTVAGQVVKRR